MIDNTSGIVPKGPRILVKPHVVDETFEGSSLVMPKELQNREQMGDTNGTVIALGNGCYNDEPEPWCQAGDHIIFAKYAGLVQKGDDGVEYRLIRDVDVVATRS